MVKGISVLGVALLTTVTVQAQMACQPTVYLLRHAEDFDDCGSKYPKCLTPAGVAHSNRYPAMLQTFESTVGLCPIKRVFAMYDTKPDGAGGTHNPIDTAAPLATELGLGAPEMFITASDGNKYYFYENIELGERPNKRNALFGSVLFDYLNGYFQTEQYSSTKGASIAIFYTRQGMPDVSTALQIPLHQAPADRVVNWPGEQRSSVNIAYWYNSAPAFQRQYSDAPYTAIRVKSYQCFNVKEDGQYSSSKYYCQYSGNLNDYTSLSNPDENLRGKICGTLDKAPPITSSTSSKIFGTC
jgi:hypothetical protein